MRACEVCCDDMFHAGQQLCGLEQQGCGPGSGSQSRHARPDQDVGVVCRDSRGCDNETTLIDGSSKPASHSCCSA